MTISRENRWTLEWTLELEMMRNKDWDGPWQIAAALAWYSQQLLDTAWTGGKGRGAMICRVSRIKALAHLLTERILEEEEV